MAVPDPSSNQPRLGKLLRLRHLKPSEIPAHPELGPQQNTGKTPDLHNFVSEALNEAESFMTAYLPLKFNVKSANKSAPPSAASVELLQHDVQGAEIPTHAPTTPAGRTAEAWFARTSIHENAAQDGTASWEEFDEGLRKDHSQHEMEYTPDVQDAHPVLSWDEQLAGGDLQRTESNVAGETSEIGNARRVGEWEDVGMALMEMVHHIPPPLNDRVFPVLVITAKHTSNQKFLVIQIPVDTTGMPRAKYSVGSQSGKYYTTGMYVSIERGELSEGGQKVKWQMATASDAKGVLPMWAQKMGVPGAVVKDVGLFIGWTAKRRVGQA